MPDIMDMGESLVRERKAQGVSQRALAERLRTTQQQVARWEAVRYRTASLERVSEVADALSVSGSAVAAMQLMAAEDPAAYATAATAVPPVRDLGEIVVRVRANAATFRDKYRFDRIAVFGAFARGEQAPGSDVDLLVETVDPGGLRFLEAAEFAERVLGRTVHLTRPHLLKPRLSERVLGEAVLVWPA